MATDTRERIVTAGAELFRRQGYTGTGVKQIVAEAQAPFGSLYHFFPGGKEQLGAEVIRWSGGMYGLLLPAIFDPAPDLVTGMRNFFALAGEHLEESGLGRRLPDRHRGAGGREHQRAAARGDRRRLRELDRRRPPSASSPAASTSRSRVSSRSR